MDFWGIGQCDASGRISSISRQRAGTATNWRCYPVNEFTHGIANVGQLHQCDIEFAFAIQRDRRALKIVPVDIGVKYPVGILTLKNRTLSPVVERFVECAREVTRRMRGGRTASKR